MPSATISFLGQYADSLNASTYTFSNVPLGNPSADRQIVAGIQSRNNGTGVSLTTCIIAGTTATIDAYNKYSPDNTNHSAIVRANIPTGTTGDITITFGGSTTMLRCGLTLWDVKGIQATPYATTTQSSTLTGQLTTKTINCLGGGLVVASATGGANVITSDSWSGLQEATSTVVETFFGITTATFQPASTTILSVSTSYTGTNFSECNSVVVAYQPTMTLSDNLVSYWKLDETSGSAVDSVGTNTLTAINSPTGTLGKIGNTRSFISGSTQYLTIGDNPSLSMGDIDFSISAWVNLDVLQNSTFVGKYQTSTNNREYAIFYNATDHVPNNRFSFIVSPDGTVGYTTVDATTTSITTGTWYHLLARHDSINNNISLRVNGGTTTSVTHTTGVFDGNANFGIGCLNALVSQAYLLSGEVDEVGLWKRYLTDAEGDQLYNSGNGLTYPFTSTTTSGGGGGTTTATDFGELLCFFQF